MEEEGLEAFSLDGVADLFEGGLLRGVEVVPGANGGLDGDGFGLESDDAFAGERAGRGAGVPDGVLELLEVVGSGMEFEEGA